MRTMSNRRFLMNHVWMVAIMAALAVGVVLGSTFAPRSEAAAQAQRTFSGEVGIDLYIVNPSKNTDFERVVRLYAESLAASSNTQRQQMGAGLKLYRAAEAGPNNYTLYYLIADPVVSGGNYGIFDVLNEEYLGGPPDNGDEMRELYAVLYDPENGALTGGGQQTINLNLVMDF